MKKVLLTGASGFIGRQCLGILLDRGYEVYATYYSKGIEMQKPNLIWHQVNLLDHKQTNILVSKIKPEYLLHLAWYAVPGKYWESPENLKWVGASLNLMECFSDAGGDHAVITGSCAEYDWSHEHCIEGVTPLNPDTLYGKCKNELNITLNKYPFHDDLILAWARIFNTYGPHEHPSRLVSSVIMSLLKNASIDCTHGEQVRDFIHVYDLATALITVMEHGFQGDINIGSGEPVKLRDILLHIGNKLGRQYLINIGAKKMTRNEPDILLPDISLLKDAIHWSPTFSLKEGLNDTIQWWQKQI